MARHPTLSVRTPEVVSTPTVQRFNPDGVNNFDVYEPDFKKIKPSSCQVSNVNETGITQ